MKEEFFAAGGGEKPDKGAESDRVEDLRGYEHNVPRPETEEKRLRARKCLVKERGR